jgi:REP element-mobilizing transposase RayT
MHTLSQEFLALCRQLGEAQSRCSEIMAAQAAELEMLRSEVMRLRAAVIVRDTRLALLQEALDDARQAQPAGLPRRKEMARHIRMLAERVTALSRESLRWRLQATSSTPQNSVPSSFAAPAPASAASASQSPAQGSAVRAAQAHLSTHALDESLAAADLVICQTGCISHDEYWRVQDHCRRTGKPCILVDHACASAADAVLSQPVMLLRMAGGLRPGLSGNAPSTLQHSPSFTRVLQGSEAE